MSSLREYMEQQGFRFTRKTYGGEWESACPNCHGRNRFMVWDDSNRFYCRQCEIMGDFIAYLREVEGKSWDDAKRISGKYVPPKVKFNSNPLAPKPRVWTPSPAKVPPLAWSQRALNVVDTATKALWQRPETLDYLHKRGLKDDTIHLAQLGWLDRLTYDNRRLWGLPVQDGKEKIALPSGLLIPYWYNAEVIRLRVRVQIPTIGNRYHLVAGSSLRPGFFGQGQKAVMVVENDLDAMVVAQEAGDLIQSLAMLSCSYRPDSDSHPMLMKSKILLSLDDDDSGQKQMAGFWKTNFPNATIHLPMVGKDVGEMAEKNGHIRQWVEAGLR